MKKSYPIMQSNSLVRELVPNNDSHAILSLTERRILWYLMSRIVKDTDAFDMEKIGIGEFIDEFDLSHGGKQKESITKAVEYLTTAEYTIGDICVHWLSQDSNVEDDTMCICLSDELQKYLLNLDDYFTAYAVGFATALTSKYSALIYEWMQSFAGQGLYKMRLKDAYKYFSGNKHKNLSALLQKIIDPSLCEINEVTDIRVSYKIVMSGGKPTHIMFSIHPKKNEEIDELTIDWDEVETDWVDISRAKSVDLVTFLVDQHPDLITYNSRKGRYTNPGHNSVAFDTRHNLFQRFSNGVGGDAITYLQLYADMTFKEAVAELNTYANLNPGKCVDNYDLLDFESAYNPPEKCELMLSGIIGYLLNRGIPEDVSTELIDRGLLYSDAKANCVFCRNDAAKEMCIVKGTAKKYNNIATRIPNNYWYMTEGEDPHDIYVFESPIDAVSFYCCDGRHEGIYCAMAGLKPKTLKRIAKEQNPNGDKTIHLCVDWDEAGITFAKKYKDFEHIDRPCFASKNCKDWNDVLCEL